MFDLEHPKFIINDGNIILGRVVLHKDLLRDHQGKTIGGGWWHYDRESHTMYLYGKSIDFGAVTEEQVREAWDNSHHVESGMKMIFSSEEQLEYVLHPEKKKGANMMLQANQGWIKVGECDMPEVPIINPEHVGIDVGKKDTVILEHGRRQGKSRIAVMTGGLDHHHRAVQTALTSLENSGVELVNLNDHSFRKEQPEPLPYMNPYENLHPLNISPFGAERKKKKACTSHEYVKKGEEKREGIGGTILKELWRCRHCDHPMF